MMIVHELSGVFSNQLCGCSATDASFEVEMVLGMRVVDAGGTVGVNRPIDRPIDSKRRLSGAGTQDR